MTNPVFDNTGQKLSTKIEKKKEEDIILERCHGTRVMGFQ